MSKEESGHTKRADNLWRARDISFVLVSIIEPIINNRVVCTLLFKSPFQSKTENIDGREIS